MDNTSVQPPIKMVKEIFGLNPNTYMVTTNEAFISMHPDKAIRNIEEEKRCFDEKTNTGVIVGYNYHGIEVFRVIASRANISRYQQNQ